METGFLIFLIGTGLIPLGTSCFFVWKMILMTKKITHNNSKIMSQIVTFFGSGFGIFICIMVLYTIYKPIINNESGITNGIILVYGPIFVAVGTGIIYGGCMILIFGLEKLGNHLTKSST